MTGFCTHEFATRPIAIRRALANHRVWLEMTLGVALANVVIFQANLNLAQIGVEGVLGCLDPSGETSMIMNRLRPMIESANVPPDFPPLVEVSTVEPHENVDLRRLLQAPQDVPRFGVEWTDCPVALRLHGVDCPVVAINASYHPGPGSEYEETVRLVIARRDCAAQLLQLLDNLNRRDRHPRLHILYGSSHRIAKCGWEQLVLDPSVISLLKEDFESFFDRAQWFEDMHLPFRRGYLLHGPPGNGKSTAIRAMMTSRGLPAYTLRFFSPDTDDRHLDLVFENALKNRPAMVLLEDIDRAFPKTGESKSGVSLQQLLNCIDGVGSGEGVIVVATANEPTLLDPAILRRPGRFDRVVHFPNPDVGLRQAYFLRMTPAIEAAMLEQVASESEGFSFAQLREAFIMAGQLAFRRNSDIDTTDLVAGIRCLRQTVVASSSRRNSSGFKAAPSSEVVV